MRPSFISISLAACGGTFVSAAAIPGPAKAPALPLDAFNTTQIFIDTVGSAPKPLTFTDVLDFVKDKTKIPDVVSPNTKVFAAAATCTNPRVRVEWDSYPAADRQAYITAIRCLQTKGSAGGFAGSKSRYEDFVALHQGLTPNVHNNHKFLIWHRFYIWAFEDALRTECGFTGSIPWWDETKYAGRFQDSSVFSNDYYGAVDVGGNCVTNGVSTN